MRLILGLIFSWLIIFSVTTAQSQTTVSISGRVIDQQGAGVAGARITLHERDDRTRFTVTADESGAYRAQQLPPGEYLVEVEAEGFARSTAEARLGRDAQTTLDFNLSVRTLNTEVIVTASGTAQSVDEVSKAITVVGSAEIERRVEGSLIEALRVVPGLRVQQQGGPGAFTAIKMRGLRNRDTALLIDGLRYRDAGAPEGDATSLFEDVLITNVDRLEILRGSGSSLYGSNAIGGVINLFTEQGGGPVHGGAQIEGGSLGLFRGRAQIGGGLDEDRFRYSAGIAHLNVTRGVDGNDAARKTNAQAFLQYNFTPRASLTGRIFAVNSFLQLNGNVVPTDNLPASGPVRALSLAESEQRRLENGVPFSEINVAAATYVPALDDPDDRRTARAFSGALTFAQRLSDDFSYRINYQRLNTKRTSRRGRGGVEYPSLFIFQPAFTDISVFDGTVDTLNARADLQTGRSNLITAGYEYEREAFDNPARDENPDPVARLNTLTSIRQRSHTLYAQDQLRLFENRLQLSAAVRMQRFALSQPIFEGGTSAYPSTAYNAPPTAYTADGAVSYFFPVTETKLRAHVGNGYRSPSLYERFGTYFSSFFGKSFSPLGDPMLRPERSIAFDGGVDQGFFGGRMRTSATYFYTRLQEIIDFGSVASNDPYGRFFGYINTGGGLARGMELSVTANPSRTLELSASYTYTNADGRSAIAQDFLRSFGISDHALTLYVNQRVGRRVDLTFDLYAASEYAFPLFAATGTRAFIFEGPVKADLGASYTLPLADDKRSLRFYGKVDNIFDRTYYENGFRAPGAAFIGGVGYRF